MEPEANFPFFCRHLGFPHTRKLYQWNLLMELIGVIDVVHTDMTTRNLFNVITV